MTNVQKSPAGVSSRPRVSEPLDLLAVVRDPQGRRYFRWSYDAHTFGPWRLLGAVHADTEEQFRWSDLVEAREPVAIESLGVGEPGGREQGIRCSECGCKTSSASIPDARCRACGRTPRG